MNISAPFIHRPIATALLMVGLLVGGLVSYPLLPVAALPNVNYPTLQVTAQLPGADPQTMASSVATPLELQFGEIPGLTQMTSASALGYTQITLQFDLNRQIDGTVSDTLSAINAATPYLPTGMPYPPTIRKVNPAHRTRSTWSRRRWPGWSPSAPPMRSPSFEGSPSTRCLG